MHQFLTVSIVTTKNLLESYRSRTYILPGGDRYFITGVEPAPQARSSSNRAPLNH